MKRCQPVVLRLRVLPHSGIASTPITNLSGGFLNDPLGLTFAPLHDLTAANSHNGNHVEVTPFTCQQASLMAAPTGVTFVDDATKSFNLLH